ncbi:hypothetical protein P8452_69322 [Trifolium repens]|nr:hypothetical protein P8452_69322 [Trifolium repens]
MQKGDVYGGGPTDFSILSLYHEHKAILIWHAHSEHDIVKNPMRSLANGKKILNVPKSKKDELWFWGHQLDDEWLYVFLIMLAAMTGLGGGGRKDVVFLS